MVVGECLMAKDNKIGRGNKYFVGRCRRRCRERRNAVWSWQAYQAASGDNGQLGDRHIHRRNSRLFEGNPSSTR